MNKKKLTWARISRFSRASSPRPEDRPGSPCTWGDPLFQSLDHLLHRTGQHRLIHWQNFQRCTEPHSAQWWTRGRRFRRRSRATSDSAGVSACLSPLLGLRMSANFSSCRFWDQCSFWSEWVFRTIPFFGGAHFPRKTGRRRLWHFERRFCRRRHFVGQATDNGPGCCTPERPASWAPSPMRRGSVGGWMTLSCRPSGRRRFRSCRRPPRPTQCRPTGCRTAARGSRGRGSGNEWGKCRRRNSLWFSPA